MMCMNLKITHGNVNVLHWAVNMTAYSGYVEHSDFYIDPQEYYEAFKFLVELAVGSGETVFYIGKAVDNGYDFELKDVMKVVWNGYDWVKGE